MFVEGIEDLTNRMKYSRKDEWLDNRILVSKEEMNGIRERSKGPDLNNMNIISLRSLGFIPQSMRTLKCGKEEEYNQICIFETPWIMS